MLLNVNICGIKMTYILETLFYFCSNALCLKLLKSSDWGKLMRLEIKKIIYIPTPRTKALYGLQCLRYPSWCITLNHQTAIVIPIWQSKKGRIRKFKWLVRWYKTIRLTQNPVCYIYPAKPPFSFWSLT